MSTGMDATTSPAVPGGTPATLAAAGPATVDAKLDRALRLLEEQEARRQDLEEIVADLMPAVNGVLRLATTRLDELEKSGALELLPMAGAAVTVLKRPSTLAPLGPWALFRSLRDPDVVRGLAVLMELLRALGQAARPEKE